MTRDAMLHWAQRGLIGIGVGLAAWCAAILAEARFHQTLPQPPPLTVTQTEIGRASCRERV